MELADIVVHECWTPDGHLEFRKEYTMNSAQKIYGNGVYPKRFVIYAKPEEPPKDVIQDAVHEGIAAYARLNGLLQKEVRELRSQIPTWIRVEDNEPPEGPLLCGDSYLKESYEAFWDGRLFSDDGMIRRPTHWMPLPQPPKETE